MTPALPIDWWPEKQILRAPIRSVLVCSRKLHPPAYSHIVNFPRLEFPVHGCYENKIESNGEVITVKLKPGDALFAAPNCWNFPVWHQGLELMSLLFGAKQIGISIVTAQRRRSPQLAAKKFSIPRPLTGPLPHLVEAMVELQASNSVSKMFPDSRGRLSTNVSEMLPAAARSRREYGRSRCWKTSWCLSCKTIISMTFPASPWPNSSMFRPRIFPVCFKPAAT